MAKRNVFGFETNKNADGFDIAGGTTSRKLTITGGDFTFTNSGNRTYTFPAANETIAALGQVQTFSAKQTFGTDISVTGLTINAQADGAIASGDFAFSITKNDASTKAFSGLRIKPTLNTGGSNLNTTLNIFEIDTTNTAVTGLSTNNLFKASYGGTQRLALNSAGNLVMGSAALSTSATDGFFYLNSTAGLPTGTPTANTGRVPINVDTTNGRLYGYFSSSWKNLSSDWYNVVQYGADPTGTNDSLSAFQAARDAAKNSAKGTGIVYIPAGNYKLSNTFQIGDGTSTTVSTYQSIKVIGAGGPRLASTANNAGVKIIWSGSAGGTVIKFAGPQGGCGIENVTIDCDGTNDAAVGLHVMHCEAFVMKNVHILNNTGIAVDIDSYDAVTFTGTSVFNGGNTGFVDNLMINTTVNGAQGVRIGATGNICQWVFKGGAWRLDGTTGSSSLILQYADHNTFIGVTANAETGITFKPIAAYPSFPVNNFFIASSFNGTAITGNTTVIDNSAATWNPVAGYGTPFMFYPTADGGIVPSDGRLWGLSDKKMFFGAFNFRDNLTLDDNLTFSAAAKRIKGDFTNSTHANRVMFQTSTTNSGTFVGAMPAGTGTQSGFLFYSGSDPDNASYGRLFANGTFGTILDSNKTGSGTSAPLYLNTSGNIGLTVDALSATPNVVVGTAAAVSTSGTNGFLYIPTCAGTPSGTPSAYTGKSPVIVDSTNHILYFYDGSWRNAGGSGGAPFTDSTAIVKGSSDATKLLRFEVDGFTTGTTRVVTVPNADFTMVGEDTPQALTNKTFDASTNTIIVSLSDLDASISTATFNQTSFNTTFNHTTGLFTYTWTGNTSTNSMFKINSTNTSATGYLLDVIADSTSSSAKPFRLQAKQNTIFDTDAFGNITLAARPQNTAVTAPSVLTITAPAHTSLSASTEVVDLNFNLNRTVTRAAGAVTLDRAVRFQGRTLAFGGTSTVTDAINVDIETISAGGSATITRSTGLRVKPTVNTHHGIWVDGPSSYQGDALALGFLAGKIVRFVAGNGVMNSVFNDNGSLASNATDGFQYISRVDSGTNPSGTPTAYNGSSPIVLQSDTSGGNYRIHSYLNNAWRTFPSTTSTDTLTNKTISGSSNTLTNIANASLTNSSITVNGTTNQIETTSSSLSLGGTTTLSVAANIAAAASLANYYNCV